MTQTLIEQLEMLAARYKDSYSSAYNMEEDLRAIIEQHKMPVGYQRKHPKQGWIWVEYDDIPHYERQGQQIRPLYA